MPVTSVTKEPESLTMTVIADFGVPVERLWEAYADARQLERFWGPPTYPANFSRHDFHPGGRSTYTMTGPDGDTSSGYWEFLAVDAPHRFEVLDGFAQPDGTPNPDMPTMRMVFEFIATEDGSRLTTTTYFTDADSFEKLLEMGIEEGMLAAMSQIDDVLATVH